MRTDERQKLVGLRLRLQVGVQWEPVEALDWNRVGFNFHSGHDLADMVLSFKRGLIQFSGSIAWRSTNADPQVLRTVLVNEFLYQKARELNANPQVHERLVKLIRTDDMLVEKRNALTTLGVNMSDARLDGLVQQRQSEHPMHRYGIKVDAQAWTTIVDGARELTSVVDALDKWSGAFGKTVR